MHKGICCEIRIRRYLIAGDKPLDILPVNMAGAVVAGAIEDPFDVSSVLAQTHKNDLRFNKTRLRLHKRDRHLAEAILLETLHVVWIVHARVILSIPRTANALQRSIIGKQCIGKHERPIGGAESCAIILQPPVGSGIRHGNASLTRETVVYHQPPRRLELDAHICRQRHGVARQRHGTSIQRRNLNAGNAAAIIVGKLHRPIAERHRLFSCPRAFDIGSKQRTAAERNYPKRDSVHFTPHSFRKMQ